MKRIIYALLLSLLLFAPSCRRRTVIPDSELALIFRDAFLANAYVYDANVLFDTVQVYQPIFDHYGYSVEDVAYTVGSFSKRKSARLSDVVESAIKLLEQGGKIYTHETVILDTIDAIALRQARRVIYTDSVVNFHSLRDTINMKIELDSLPAGSYNLTFDYLVDSLDNNRSSYRSMSWSEFPGEDKKRGLATSYLRKRQVESINRVIKSDTMIHKLVIMLAESYEVKRSPHVTFKDIKMEYTPQLEESVDLLFKRNLDIRIFANDFFNLLPTDSLELPSL